MASVYIISENGKLGRKDETLVFTQFDGTVTILFPFKTEHLVLVGNISLSGDAIRLLTKYRISTTFLSSNGKFNGKLLFGDTKNVFLRQKQYHILEDEKKSFEIARDIVTGKIKNQISFMQRIKRKNNILLQNVENAINDIKNILEDVSKSDNLDTVRGYEGLASKKYFEVFGTNIFPDWALFNKRSKNPPRTNVNAVLSFLYTLLSYRIESALESVGLDICVGNLHVINYGRAALVFDIIEEFRSPIADSLCCALFNLGTLKPEDFEKVDFTNEEAPFPNQIKEGDMFNDSENIEFDTGIKGVLLTKLGLKKVIKAFEEKMDTLILYQPLNMKISYSKIIYEQVAHYKRVITGEESEYKAYYFK